MVLELVVDEKDKKEKGGKVVLDLSAAGEPVHGLQQLPLPNDRLLVLLTTPKRLYAFAGAGGLEAALSGYQDTSGRQAPRCYCGDSTCQRRAGCIWWVVFQRKHTACQRDLL